MDDMDAAEDHEARDKAEVEIRVMSDLLANVSHEMRTPLMLILGPLDVILDGGSGQLSDPMRKCLERVRRNAARLTALVDDLLDVSRLEAGKWQVVWQPVPIVEVVSQLVDDTRPAAEARGLDLRLMVDGDPGAVLLDRRMFDKIILNLLGNAIKFTPSGGSIDVELRDLGVDLEITVADTGEGIPADQLPLLFQRYGQVDRAARRRSYGTGLGLALVKEFAELMGGRVAVDSQLGLGARFQVRLPRTELDQMHKPGSIRSGPQMLTPM